MARKPKQPKKQVLRALEESSSDSETERHIQHHQTTHHIKTESSDNDHIETERPNTIDEQQQQPIATATFDDVIEPQNNNEQQEQEQQQQQQQQQSESFASVSAGASANASASASAGASAITGASVASPEECKEPLKKRKRRENLRIQESKIEKRQIDIPLPGPEINKHIAFCCFRCTCPIERKLLVCDEDTEDGIIEPARDCLYHRRCCHKALKFNHTWLCPLQRALWKAEPKTKEDWDKLDTAVIQESSLVSYEDLFGKYANAKKEESKMFNDDSCAGQDSILNTNIEYNKMRKDFMDRTKQHRVRESAVVVNMFGGIGSAIVALKKLKIAISMIIHVENDKVATTVYRWNHHPFIGQTISPTHATGDSNCAIKHIYFKTIQDFRTAIKEKQLDTHIDIVIGAPPASDFAGINPHRAGVDGEQGSLILQFAESIVEIQKAQDHPLYYLIGNTIIKNQSKIDYKDGDLEKIKYKLGLTWSIEFDASDVSPCKRKSAFFSNIPFEFIDYYKGVDISADTCLEDNYQYPGNIFEEDGIVSKALTFMPHLNNLDDNRMMVYQKLGNEKKLKHSKFLKRPTRDTEREKMMGLPKNYVIEPVYDLCTQLTMKGFGDGRRFDDNNEYISKHWKYSLPKYYHRFGGNYHNLEESSRAYKFHAVVGQPVVVKLAPPQTKKTVYHYSKDEYTKRLIGNTFSIPVLEEILKPLKNVFAETTYIGYDYKYAWSS